MKKRGGGLTQQTAFRLQKELVKKLDAYGARLRSEQPGLEVTRADVVRMLLTRALKDVAP